MPANELLGLGPGQVFVQRNVGNLATHKDMNVMSCLEYGVDGGCPPAAYGLLVCCMLLLRQLRRHQFHLRSTAHCCRLAHWLLRPPTLLRHVPCLPAVLKVKHIIVCGHYGCGAVQGALTMPCKTPGQHRRCLPPASANAGGRQLCSALAILPGFCTSPRTALRCAPALPLVPARPLPPAGLVNLWIQDIRDTRDKNIEALRQLRGPQQVDKLVELNVMRQVGCRWVGARSVGRWAAD